MKRQNGVEMLLTAVKCLMAEAVPQRKKKLMFDCKVSISLILISQAGICSGYYCRAVLCCVHETCYNWNFFGIYKTFFLYTQGARAFCFAEADGVSRARLTARCECERVSRSSADRGTCKFWVPDGKLYNHQISMGYRIGQLGTVGSLFAIDWCTTHP